MNHLQPQKYIITVSDELELALKNAAVKYSIDKHKVIERSLYLMRDLSMADGINLIYKEKRVPVYISETHKNLCKN